jgi:hypothetical protein
VAHSSAQSATIADAFAALFPRYFPHLLQALCRAILASFAGRSYLVARHCVLARRACFALRECVRHCGGGLGGVLDGGEGVFIGNRHSRLHRRTERHP